MPVSYILLGVILLAGMAYSIIARKLTIIAAFTGAVVATGIFVGAGFTGVAMMTAFFILGSAATSWKKELKERTGAAEKSSGRTVGQVLANAGVAGMCGLLAYYYPQNTVLLQLMVAASLASATADTLSSELGMVYGRRFYNIITLKKDTKGLDGVVSAEGFLIGIAGSSIVAVIYGLGFGFGWPVVAIIIAGTAGNIADSVLGATVERKRLIGNNVVNFLNTAIAALVVLLMI